MLVTWSGSGRGSGRGVGTDDVGDELGERGVAGVADEPGDVLPGVEPGPHGIAGARGIGVDDDLQ